jgi:hypothetical protein
LGLVSFKAFLDVVGGDGGHEDEGLEDVEVDKELEYRELGDKELEHEELKGDFDGVMVDALQGRTLGVGVFKAFLDIVDEGEELKDKEFGHDELEDNEPKEGEL